MASNVLEALMAMENAPQAKRGPLGEFRDDIIDILRKYGLAGSPLGALMLGDNEAQAAQ